MSQLSKPHPGPLLEEGDGAPRRIISFLEKVKEN